MKKSPFFWALLIMVAAGAIYFWQFSSMHVPPPMPAEEPGPLPIPSPSGVPQISHPVSEPAGGGAGGQSGPDLETPLPGLSQADGRMAEILGDLFGTNGLDYFILDNFIQRFVVMIDNLPQSKLPATRLPTRPVPGRFQVSGQEDDFVIDPENYRRYTPFIRLAENVDMQLLVAVYTRFYPLFQQAYENLGYPHGYFNDRLIEVIDHLLAAPQVSDPIRLVRSKIRYHFADPVLEESSAGWKILIRSGPENSHRIKRVLREVRALIAAGEN